MRTIFSFFVFVGAMMLLSRTAAWGRRALARHRKQWMDQGYQERNPAWRLRQDRYRRVALIAYVGIGFVICIWANSQRGFNIVGVLFASLTLPAVPTAIIWYSYRTYKEWNEPYGEVSVNMRDNQFRLVIKPLAPDGSGGTAKLETTASIGLVNPLGWLATRPQPIVEEVQR